MMQSFTQRFSFADNEHRTAYYLPSKFLSSDDRPFGAVCGNAVLIMKAHLLEFHLLSVKEIKLFLYYTLIILADILLIYGDIFFFYYQACKSQVQNKTILVYNIKQNKTTVFDILISRLFMHSSIRGLYRHPLRFVIIGCFIGCIVYLR